MIEQPPNVRFAIPKDVLPLFEMMKDVWAADAVVRQIPYSVLQLMREAEAICHKRDGWLVGLCEEDGKLIGSTALKMERWWWTADCFFLHQTWLYVDPAHRQGKCAQSLFQFGEWCRQSMAADIKAAGDNRPFIAELSFLNQTRTKAYERLWGKWGVKVGSLYLSG